MTPEQIAELRKIHDDLWFPADPFTGWFSDQNMGQRAHEIKCAVCTIRNALPDLLSLAERAVEAERERDEARQKIKVVADVVTPWMLANKIYGITATDRVKLIADALSAAEAQLRVAREALGRVENESDDQVAVDIAREALAKIGGGNE